MALRADWGGEKGRERKKGGREGEGREKRRRRRGGAFGGAGAGGGWGKGGDGHELQCIHASSTPGCECLPELVTMGLSHLKYLSPRASWAVGTGTASSIEL